MTPSMQEEEYASIEQDGAERAGRSQQEEHVGQKEVFRRHDFRYAATISTLLLCFCLCVILLGSQRRSAAGARSALIGDDLRLPDGFKSGTRQSRSTHDDPLVDSIFNGARPAPPKRSFSIPPAGIFTGHTHKPRGTPLTFGENTYFNVYDPNPETEQCAPGTTGVAGKPEQCGECQENHFCPGGQEAFDCPAHTVAPPSSYRRSHCTCEPGFYGQIGDEAMSRGAGACKRCTAMSYCPGGTESIPCQVNSVSGAGATECKCIAGYFNNDLGECQVCAPGFWCPGGGLMKACPEHSTSSSGATHLGDCSCSPGFFQPWPADDEKEGVPTCKHCYAGAYCPGGEVALPCTSNSISEMGSSKADACVCSPGYFGGGSTRCEACESGYFCPGGLDPVACPDKSTSNAAASSVIQCDCVAGYSGKGGVCTICPAGSYCRGGDSVLRCPDKTVSDAGSTQCVCAPGYRGDAFNCQPCPEDEYCPGSGQEAPCPANTHASKSATRARECVCTRGFTGTGGADCNPCPPNSYCPIPGGEVRSCPVNSGSNAGSTSASQCACMSGYYNRLGRKNALTEPDCQLCPAGSYCPDGNEVKCPLKMTSVQGSDSLEDCKCSPGHYRDNDVCNLCPPGQYCAGGAAKQLCPPLTTSDVGAAAPSECKCVPGKYGGPLEQNGCEPCDAGFFCVGGSAREACPSKSTSDVGMSECVCAAGYWGSSAKTCQECPAGKYCPGGLNALACPSNSKSPPKSTSVLDCQCTKGYLLVSTSLTDLRCDLCRAGSYCPGDGLVQKCPDGKTSNAGAGAMRACGCGAGYYDSGTVPQTNFAWVYMGNVRIKNQGLYKFCITSSDGSRLTVNEAVVANNDGIHLPLQRCADLLLKEGLASVKVEGFKSVGQLKMSLTLRGPDTDNTDVLAESEIDGAPIWRVRMYSSDHLLVRIPDVNTLESLTSLELLGEAEVKTINVQEASDLDDLIAGSCAVCRKGHYCPGAFPTTDENPKALEVSCPGSRFSSNAGAVSIGECNDCRPGYFGKNWQDCQACLQDSYCPGGWRAMRCPPGSVTRGSARHNIRHCICDKGYEVTEGSVATWDCEKCRKSHYCPSVGMGAEVCPGNLVSPLGSTDVSECTCAAGQYYQGSSCQACTAGYFCIGDGNRMPCGPNSGSNESSSSATQCVPDDAQAFGDQYQVSLPTCQLKQCAKKWLGTLMHECEQDKVCRGVTMETSSVYGLGCMAVGLKSCLTDLTRSDDPIPKTFYPKRMDLQAKDSVDLMRAIGKEVPTCRRSGQPVVLHQFCSPYMIFQINAWKGLLYKGSWSEISRTGCDDDLQICTDSSCNVPAAALSSLDVPAGLEVHLYSEEGFEGDQLVLYGPIDADDICLNNKKRSEGKSWSSSVKSIKIMDDARPKCPVNSKAPEGYLGLADCTCNPGYSGPPGTCSACVTGKYKTATGSALCSDCAAGTYSSAVAATADSTCTSCPTNSYSPQGSVKSSDCVCNAGYYGANGDCALCAAGRYCTGGQAQLKCSAGMMSDAGSSKETDCTCAPGSYGDTQTGCQQCPAGSFCPGGTVKTACPANSDSESGQDVVDDCKCKAGHFGSGSHGCTICPRGSYCAGDGLASPCTDNSDSLAGSVSCVCLDKYYQKQDGTCSLCPSNSFCPTDSKKLPPIACPTASTSPAGSTVARQCSCVDGFSNLAYSAKANYFVVEEGTFAEVKKKCEDQNGDLSSINNVVEQMTAASLCPNCWIGFQRTGGPFEWVDGHEIDFTMWALGEPKNGASNAVYFLDKESDGKGQTFRWRAESGNTKYKGICKKRAVAPECVLGYSPHDLKLDTGFLTEFFYSLPSFDEMETANSKQLLRKQIAGLLTNVPSKEVVQDGVSYPSLASFSLVEPGAAGRDRMAAGFNGVLQVFKAGNYEFSSTSEDGSWVCVDSFSIVQNGGMHNPISANGNIPLKTGYHFITAVWFEAGFPVLTRLKDIGKETIFAERGGGAAQYLDRHSVNCMPQSAVSQFKLQVSQNSMKYVFDCAEGAKWGPAVGGTTTESDGGGGRFEYLDRHNVECPVGTAIAQFKLNGQANGNKISYSYNCIAPAVVNKMTCFDKTTAPSDAGGFGLKTEYLDRQAVNCDENQVMQRFQLKSDMPGNTLKYEYRCCTIDGRNDVNAMKTSPPRTGNGQFMLRYKGDDTSQTWIDVPVNHFPRAQRRLPDPNTLGMSRGWNVRVWNYPNAEKQANEMMARDPDTGGFPKFDWATNSFVIGKPDAPILEKAATEMMYDDNRWKELGAPDDNFAAVLSGFLPVYEAGQYDFWIESDDGSRLWVDNAVPVVDNGGCHAPIKKKGTVRLSHGFHAILVQFFEATLGATLKISYSGPDTGMVEQPVNVFQSPVPPGAPPAPAVGDSPMAVVTLKDPNPGGGPAIPDNQKGRNMKCSQFANNANKKNKADQLELMAKCMSQDCAQSMEDVGCLYVTPGAGFCYTDPGQLFCKNNPSSVSCVRNFESGGEWTPVQNFPFLGGSAGLMSTGGFSTELSYINLQQSGGIRFEGNFNCVCAKRCSYQASIKAMRCAEGSNFVGPVTGSLFDKLDSTQGKNGIVKDNGKKKECACICGKANEWRTN